MTAFAGPEPGLDTGTWRGKELAILKLGFSRRTGQATKDPGRRNAHIGTPVIGRIAGQQRSIEGFGIRQIKHHHAQTLARTRGPRRRNSGVYMENTPKSPVLCGSTIKTVLRAMKKAAR